VTYGLRLVLVLAAGVNAAARPQLYAQPVGQSGHVTSYECNPFTCTITDLGPLLKLTMRIYGTWADFADASVTRTRGLIGTTLTNCTNNVSLTVSADTDPYDSYLGEGIEVMSHAEQFGVTIQDARRSYLCTAAVAQVEYRLVAEGHRTDEVALFHGATDLITLGNAYFDRNRTLAAV
jgi:hypothetical protein